MSVFSKPLFCNRMIAAGIAAELVLLLLIVYTPAGQALFGTAAIDARAWLIVVPFAIAMVVFEEIRKAVARRRSRPVMRSVARYAHP